MNQFADYRLWIIVGVGTMSIFLLLMVWRFYYYNHRKRNNLKTDYGLVFLISGIGMWAILAIIKLVTPVHSGGENRLAIHTLSMINNAFLLSSIPFFEYSKFLHTNQSLKRNWTVISMISALVVLVIIFFVKGTIAADILDLSFSSIIFIILGGILFRTFSERLLSSVGYLSLVVMFMTIFSQFAIAFKDRDNIIGEDLKNLGFILGGISFSMLMVILVALAFTWILDENNVFDDWNDERKAKAFWQEYQGQWAKGFMILQKEMKDELSKLFFEKSIAFFDEGLPVHESPGMQLLKQEIIISSGRFSFLKKHFNKGLMSDLIFTQEMEKIRVDVAEWLNSLLKELKPLKK